TDQIRIFSSSVDRRLELERQRVNAVAQPCGGRAIGKYMAQMGIADIAQHLGPYHAVTYVAFFSNKSCIERFEVTGPAATGVKFSVGGEKGGPAAHASIQPRSSGVPIASGKGPFGAFLARHIELLGTQLRPPL